MANLSSLPQEKSIWPEVPLGLAQFEFSRLPWQALLSSLIAVFFAVRWAGKRKHQGLKFPGPKGLPVFGNLLQLRTGHAKTLSSWAKQYGGIYQLKLGSRDGLILSTHGAVAKTLVQQGAAFQSRPEFQLWHGAFVHSADTDGILTIGTTKFNPEVANLRKILTPHTQAKKLLSYNRFVSRRYIRLIRMMTELATKTSCDVGWAMWSTTVSIGADQLVGEVQSEGIIRLICQTEIDIFRQRTIATPLHDYLSFISFGEAVLDTFANLLRPTNRVMGSKKESSMFFGAEKKAEQLRQAQAYYCKKQLAGLHARLAENDETPSILGDLFRSLSKPLSEPDQFKLATTLSGSGMATGTTLTWLIGKLAALPKLQERAFEAIQDVYGSHAPDPHELDRVDYIKALGLEAGRYFAAVRLGFSRETYQDATVDGIFVPEGTLTIYNSFEINRDPAVYDRPLEFLPERWTEGRNGRTDDAVAPNKIGVPHLTHGCGRRICMGIPNVNKTLYGTLVLLLHFFKFERTPLDESGRATVFPTFRADGDEAGAEMDPVDDQVSTTDAQGLPRATGIKVRVRDEAALAAWLSEGCNSLDGLSFGVN